MHAAALVRHRFGNWEGVPYRRETLRVNRLGHQRAVVHEQEVAGTAAPPARLRHGIAGVGGNRKNLAWLLGIVERREPDARVARVIGPVQIKEPVGIGQKLRPEVGIIPAGPIKPCHGGWNAAGRRHPVDGSPSRISGEYDDAVLVPGPAPARLSVTKGLHRAARSFNLLKLVLAE